MQGSSSTVWRPNSAVLGQSPWSSLSVAVASRTMEVLRTPDEYFDNLPGYAYTPKYFELEEHDNLRMHYVDEGPHKGRVILMLHGEPSWSYLYRNMIPIVAEAGYRAIAPDLVGFGRSDKPTKASDYSYQLHEEWLTSFVRGMNLKNIVLVCQDWGGLLGLRLVARYPELFSAVIAANTFLPTGKEPVGVTLAKWRLYSQENAEFKISQVIERGCDTGLSDQVRGAYDAPFPDESYKAGARQFPMLVPTEPDCPAGVVNAELWGALSDFDKPFVTAFSDGDPITAGADKVLQSKIAGADNRKHVTIKGGGHFLQEDRGPELAKVVLDVANAL